MAVYTIHWLKVSIKSDPEVTNSSAKRGHKFQNLSYKVYLNVLMSGLHKFSMIQTSTAF